MSSHRRQLRVDQEEVGLDMSHGFKLFIPQSLLPSSEVY